MGNEPGGFALDAHAGERLVFGDVTVLIRASAETTRGAFTVIEEVPPMVDTPLHVHANEDEMFYVLEGEHVVQCGDEEFHLGPGGVVYLPRGIPHSQRRVVPGEGRLLVLTSPRDSRDSSVNWPRLSGTARLDPTPTRRRPSTTASPGSAETAHPGPRTG